MNRVCTTASHSRSNEEIELVGNELATSYIYFQGVTVNSEENESAIAKIHTYIQNVLNDRENQMGILFYRARFYNLKNKSDTYSIHFHLMSLEHWTEAARARLMSTYFQKLQEDVPSLKLVGEEIQEETKAFNRNPVSFDHYVEGETPGFGNIPGENCCEKFLNFWLIVPRVQWDFFDLLYQMYTFDIFHQGLLAKFIHFFTIPTNVMLSMMFFAQFNLHSEIRYGNAFAVNGALILLIILALAYIVMGFLRKSWEWGLATFVVLCVLNMVGNLWYYGYRTIGNPWYNPTNVYTNPIIWSYIMSIIQASSHMLVPQIPSYISGVKHWESLHMFFIMKRKDTKSTLRHIGFVLLSLAAFPVLSASVAWFSWPHLIGTEVIYIMAGIGYRPKFFEKYFRIVEKLERYGNPVMDRFPTSYKDVLVKAPAHVEAMKSKGLLSDQATHGEVFKGIATLKLSSLYLRKGVDFFDIKHRKKTSELPETEEDHHEEKHKQAIEQLNIMLATRKGYMGKCNKA